MNTLLIQTSEHPDMILKNRCVHNHLVAVRKQPRIKYVVLYYVPSLGTPPSDLNPREAFYILTDLFFTEGVEGRCDIHFKLYQQADDGLLWPSSTKKPIYTLMSEVVDPLDENLFSKPPVFPKTPEPEAEAAASPETPGDVEQGLPNRPDDTPKPQDQDAQVTHWIKPEPASNSVTTSEELQQVVAGPTNAALELAVIALQNEVAKMLPDEVSAFTARLKQLIAKAHGVDPKQVRIQIGY